MACAARCLVGMKLRPLSGRDAVGADEGDVAAQPAGLRRSRRRPWPGEPADASAEQVHLGAAVGRGSWAATGTELVTTVLRCRAGRYRPAGRPWCRRRRGRWSRPEEANPSAASAIRVFYRERLALGQCGHLDQRDVLDTTAAVHAAQVCTSRTSRSRRIVSVVTSAGGEVGDRHPVVAQREIDQSCGAAPLRTSQSFLTNRDVAMHCYILLVGDCQESRGDWMVSVGFGYILSVQLGFSEPGRRSAQRSRPEVDIRP